MTSRGRTLLTAAGIAIGLSAGAALLAEEGGRAGKSNADAATQPGTPGGPAGNTAGKGTTASKPAGEAAGLAVAAKQVAFAVTPAPPGRRARPPAGSIPAAGILVDASTGEVLWSRGKWQRRSVASLTKMMNALVSLDRAGPDRTLAVSRAAASMGGSVVGGLPAGGRMRVGSLLRGMMLASGNDAANVLAEGLGPGRGRFVWRMNDRARRMGLRCTRFVSPEGLGAGNVSCPRDLAVLARSVLAEPKLASMLAREWDSIERGRNGRKTIRNRNPLVQRRYRGITGVKTGRTAAAGWCLVSSAKRGRHRLIAVALGSDESARQSRRLLDAGFAALSR